MKTKNVNLKILLLIGINLIISATVNSQKPAVNTKASSYAINIQEPLSNSRSKANLGNTSKNAPSKKEIERPDTVLLTTNAIANLIRNDYQKYYKTSFWSSELTITETNPLVINLSHDTNGENEVSGTFGNISINGKTTDVAKGDIHHLLDPLRIGSGEWLCKGHYTSKGIPCYFESGQVVFTDNEKPGTFSDGSIFFYNARGYKYTQSKWVKY